MKILVIHTAFIGDVILSTAVLEKLDLFYPEAELDFLVKKGNEKLFEGHPFLHEVLVFDKDGGKWSELRRLIPLVRKRQYDVVVNLHRFFSSGLITVLSGAGMTLGFDVNPLSFLFTRTEKHEKISAAGGMHEVQRNLVLISCLTDNTFDVKPRLYPPPIEIAHMDEPYVCMAPASIWFTKQWPKEKWIQLINQLEDQFHIYLLGSAQDLPLCTEIAAASGQKRIEVLAGELSLLQSAALMRTAVMNFANDSGPVHLATAVNAPMTAIFCSTVPAFGFGPLSDHARVVETSQPLECRPCGLHGYHACPQGHFKCAEIDPVVVAGALNAS